MQLVVIKIAEVFVSTLCLTEGKMRCLLAVSERERERE